MRTIQIPEPINVTVPGSMGGGAKEISFRDFAQGWLNDTRAIRGPFTKQLRWARVVSTFAHAESLITLEDEDYATLRAIVESPENTFSPLIAIQLLPFTQAVLDATEVR